MKRVFDLLISLIAALLLSPLFLIISLVILIQDGKPVFFKQERVGKNGKLFKVYKFRTMKNGTGDYATSDLNDAESKITKTGKFLRSTSIDELPQLFNIINGTMSLVGPRPLIPAEKEIHELRKKYNVYSVTPGMTGWAQVNGRDNVSHEQKARYDKEYVENRSLMFDIKIILKTIVKVLKRSDITN